MLRQDNFKVGLVVGILMPVMFFVIFHEANNLLVQYYFQKGTGFSERFIAILSVCSNLLPFVIYERSHKDHALRGMIAATFIEAFFIVFYYFRSEIF